MKVNFFRSGSIFSLMLILGLWLGGCRAENPVVESVKDIGGTWKIVEVVRNRVDITNKVKVDDFQLDFLVDSTGQNEGKGSYKITRGAPFVVNEDGTWKLNNPAYPFTISFSPASDPTKDVKLDFSFLIIKGEYQIKLILSPGCPANSYQYYLRKVN